MTVKCQCIVICACYLGGISLLFQNWQGLLAQHAIETMLACIGKPVKPPSEYTSALSEHRAGYRMQAQPCIGLCRSP